MTDLMRHMDDAMKTSVGIGSEAIRKVEKSASQGAATTVWATVVKHFDNYGGVYLADVGEASAANGQDIGPRALYADHVYNEAGEKQLWALSNELVGIAED